MEWEYWRRFREEDETSDWFLVDWQTVAEKFNDAQINWMYRGEILHTDFAEYRATRKD
jgi:hypothetical protein